MFGRDLWSLGEFKFHQDGDKTYKIEPVLEGSIRVRKYNANLVTIDKSWSIAKSKVVHCGIALYPEEQRPLDRLVVFADQIHVYHCDSNYPNSIALPKTEHDLEAFVNAGGSISVEDNLDKAILDYKNKQNVGCQFKAVGRQVFIEGNETEVCILEFDKDIDAILPSTIIFQDGTVKHLPVSLFPSNYEAKLLEKFYSKNAEIRERYLSQVRQIDEALCTPDGYNVKKLFIEIDDYLRSYSNHHKPDEQLKQKHTYEALTEMLILSKDPDNLPVIKQNMFEVQSKLRAGKDVAISVLLMVAAGALIGLGVLCCTVFALLTAAGTAGPGGLMCIGGVALIGYAGFKFHQARVGYQYNNNINRVTQFFDSKPNSVVPNEGDIKSVELPLLGNYEQVFPNPA